MEREFKSARGPSTRGSMMPGRTETLACSNFQAPGWPASIGSRSKARQHLERSVELAPDYPENHLCLLEAYLKWDDRKNVRREFEDCGRTSAQGAKDSPARPGAQSWADWTNAEKDSGEGQKVISWFCRLTFRRELINLRSCDLSLCSAGHALVKLLRKESGGAGSNVHAGSDGQSDGQRPAPPHPRERRV